MIVEILSPDAVRLTVTRNELAKLITAMSRGRRPCGGYGPPDLSAQWQQVEHHLATAHLEGDTVAQDWSHNEET